MLTFARAWDVASKKQGAACYFWPLLAGYGSGLVLTDLVMIWSEAAQPTLLYLVPCTLLPFLLLAWCKGEGGMLWLGLNPKAVGTLGMEAADVNRSEQQPELEQLL